MKNAGLQQLLINSLIFEKLNQLNFMVNNVFDRKQLFKSLGETSEEFLKLISSPDESTINAKPFEGSWTVLELASHVTKSNNAIEQSLHMEGKVARRDPGERVPELKNLFLDFSTKFHAPDFIKPTTGYHQKETILTGYKESVELLKKTSGLVNVDEIINLPVFGEITKLELLHFVLYHTQRHIHQLKKILTKAETKNK